MAPTGLPFPEYFSELASNYARQTGNSTRYLFNASFDDITAALPITKDSVIHDNAAGPGTATSVIVDKIPTKSEVPEVLITDFVPPMVAGARQSFEAWPQIRAQKIDSLNLADIPDNHFTHSVLNFSIFTFSDPLKGLQEIRRTLKPGGLAALLTWKRFGAGAVVHAAQASIRPDLPPMKIAGAEFLDEGYLADMAVKAGFGRGKMSVSSKSIVVAGPDMEGLRSFSMGKFTEPAKAGWTDEEKARWGGAIDGAFQKEVDEFGGVKFESWVVLVKK